MPDMDGLPSEYSSLERVDVAVVQGTRHGLAFARSMLAGLKVGRYRSYLSAERALRDMKLDPPSLLISDWEPKARSGYWLVTTMRSSEVEALRSVPILILTSEISPTMLDVALDTGANAVVVKPISAVLLRRRIEALVRQPQRLVEHEDRLIPEAAKDALENRLRVNESASSRAHRLQLRDALERNENEISAMEQEALAPRTGTETGEAEDFHWEGFSAA